MALFALFMFAGFVPLIAATKGDVPRWCAIKGPEAMKCAKWAEKLGTDKLECIIAVDKRDCYNRIAKGLADLASFDGGDIYEAGRLLNLKPIMAETSVDSPGMNSKYYAIAVVRAGTKWTMSNLKGQASSCHTGVKRTSGWNAPVGYLLRSRKMELKDCNVFKSVASFFNGSCAPGANNEYYNPGLVSADKLCQKCIGNGYGQYICSRDSKETYSGYHGAFKCLQDSAGDVAFIKHSILLQKGVNQSNFKLLCKDDTQKDPKDYKKCYITISPTHAVLTSSEKSAKQVRQYQKFLRKSDRMYGRRAKDTFALFKDGLLFSRSTAKLSMIPFTKQDYRKYLDGSYIEMMEGLAACQE